LISAPSVLANYTTLQSELLYSKLKMQLLEVERGHVPHCPIAGDVVIYSASQFDPVPSIGASLALPHKEAAAPCVLQPSPYM